MLPARQAVALPDERLVRRRRKPGHPGSHGPALPDRRRRRPALARPSSALTAVTVLVAGGAGAVGHAAIQLARWAGALVITTVSSDEKGRLARAAGADHVVDYRSSRAAEDIRALAPAGVDVIVEVSPAVNAPLDTAVLASDGTVAVYATDGGNDLGLEVWRLMQRNVRYRFVLVYTVPNEAKDRAVADVSAAVADGALPVGEEAGLPLHRFPLERTADAHAAVEAGAVGKVLIDVASDGT